MNPEAGHAALAVAVVLFLAALPIGATFGAWMVFFFGILVGWTLGAFAGWPGWLCGIIYQLLMAFVPLGVIASTYLLTRTAGAPVRIVTWAGTAGFALGYFFMWMGFTFGNIR